MKANIRTIGGSVGAAVMASIVTSQLASDGLPKQAGYTIGFGMLAVSLVVAAIAALFIPSSPVQASAVTTSVDEEPEHAELALLAGGTVVGDKSE